MYLAGVDTQSVKSDVLDHISALHCYNVLLYIPHYSLWCFPSYFWHTSAHFPCISTFPHFGHISVLWNTLHLHHITLELRRHYHIIHHHFVMPQMWLGPRSSINQLITFLLSYLAFTISYVYFWAFHGDSFIPSLLLLFYILGLFHSYCFLCPYLFSLGFLAQKLL